MVLLLHLLTTTVISIKLEKYVLQVGLMDILFSLSFFGINVAKKISVFQSNLQSQDGKFE